MLMDKTQADALCAIVSLGFVSQNEKEDRTGRILYLYDNKKDEEKHKKLIEILQRTFGINLAVKIQNAKDGEIKVHPFIYALPYGNENEPKRRTHDEVKVKEQPILDVINIMETAANSLIDPANHFRGAYIGGFINYEKPAISLIGPSSLYLRDRVYLKMEDPSPTAVTASFIDASKVTEEIKNILKENVRSFHTGDEIYGAIEVDSALTDALISEGKLHDDECILDQGKIFSSCHGLVTAMYYHSDVSKEHLDEGVCIEVALSNDTCKSASCIPCAIFAASQGAPASAIHFGRGDFWNLPTTAIRNSLNENFEKNWRAFVIACFMAGGQKILSCKSLKQGAFTSATVQMAELSDNQEDLVQIPDMFLDALTFEGAFIDKMINSLESN